MNNLPFKTPKEAYEYILQNPNSNYKQQAEELIISVPHLIYLYTNYVIQKRWKFGENYILKNKHNSYIYALCIIKGRWPKLEKMLNTKYESIFYVLNILKKRLKKDETNFKKQYLPKYLNIIIKFDHE